MLFLIGAMLMPPQILADNRLRSCEARQSFNIAAPHLRVKPSASGRALSLHIALLSTVGATGDRSATTIHAFVRVDDRSVLLNLPPGGYISLTYPDLGRGTHRVRYGVYRGMSLLNGGITCLRV